MPREGRVGQKKPSEAESLAMMSGWYTAKNVDISAEATDITVQTKWPGYVLRAFGDNSGSVGTAVVVTKAGDEYTLKVPANGQTPIQPEIAKVKKSGSSNSLLFYFQKR